ncbi:MAG: methylenetetrahydrofolate reductase [NAD(P)H] [Tissierellia bacterium]|nr:methylenetetrahydrofolate reductase [NAD(P)H] [Tissierellia bacterium]MDD4726550.1 methylenetetrahydrofolate reductase [NAD(P)H] [Tissierellia bacterium]
MRIVKLFEEKEFVYSFEIFPPKPVYPIDSVYSTIDELSKLKPDFISVTYGAGGSITNNRTAEIASIIKNKYSIEALAHLTCVNSTKEQINHVINDLKEKGIENILALRGDIIEGGEPLGIFKNSQDIIRFAKANSDFGISAASYPEGHMESKDKSIDVEILKLKEEAGADHFVSQVFFDNKYFYELLNKAEQKGVKSPIQAGVMPVVNKKQIERIISLSGCSIPEKFIKIINKYEHDKEALRDAGIAFALDQIVDLISSGVKGVHLYTMNNPYIAKIITNSISSIANNVNSKN